MITVFQEPTDDSPKFGIMWPLFKNMQVAGHTSEKFENKATALHALDIHKAWIVIGNFEEARIHFENWFPQDQILQNHKEAVQALRNMAEGMANNRENYDLVLKEALSGGQYLRVLVKNTPKEQKPVMRMMCSVLMKYVKEELDARSKDKAEDEVAEG